MSELIRSFVAVDISAGALQQLGDLLVELRRKESAQVRWVRPELMHLTLAFLGEVSQGLIESTKVQLALVVPRHRPFTAQLSGLGAFPSPSSARVVWAGMEQGRDEVCALQEGVVGGLRSIGYQPEKRRFSPHLTIGRLRIPSDVNQVVSVQFRSETFLVDRVVLFRSVLKPEGPVYSRLAEFPFQTG